MARERMGEDWRRYFPLVGTIFFFILVSNLLGLVPGLDGATSDTNTTWAWAIIAWVFYTAIGIARHKGAYLVKFMGPSFFEREIFGRHVHFRLLAPVFLVLEIPLDAARMLSKSREHEERGGRGILQVAHTQVGDVEAQLLGEQDQVAPVVELRAVDLREDAQLRGISELGRGHGGTPFARSAPTGRGRLRAPLSTGTGAPDGTEAPDRPSPAPADAHHHPRSSRSGARGGRIPGR